MLHTGKSFLVTLLGFALLTLCAGSESALAQAAGEPAAASQESAPEEATPIPTLDLGSFKINDLRPTRSETAKLTFTLHLAFSKDLNKAQLAQLAAWKHRFREQIITAVRISEMKDFQEPDLHRLRRRVLIRVNRLLKAKLVEEVLVTKYLFRLH